MRHMPYLYFSCGLSTAQWNRKSWLLLQKMLISNAKLLWDAWCNVLHNKLSRCAFLKYENISEYTQNNIMFVRYVLIIFIIKTDVDRTKCIYSSHRDYRCLRRTLNIDSEWCNRKAECSVIEPRTTNQHRKSIKKSHTKN